MHILSKEQQTSSTALWVAAWWSFAKLLWARTVRDLGPRRGEVVFLVEGSGGWQPIRKGADGHALLGRERDVWDNVRDASRTMDGNLPSLLGDEEMLPLAEWLSSLLAGLSALLVVPWESCLVLVSVGRDERCGFSTTIVAYLSILSAYSSILTRRMRSSFTFSNERRSPSRSAMRAWGRSATKGGTSGGECVPAFLPARAPTRFCRARICAILFGGSEGLRRGSGPGRWRRGAGESGRAGVGRVAAAVGAAAGAAGAGRPAGRGRA
jgi:hypothetical protein